MREIWFSSDCHYNHKNILNFKDEDGKFIRDFSSVDEMNEVMIQKHNELVKPNDIFYNLGDVYFSSKEKAGLILSRLMGKKRLLVGNHDNIKDNVLTKHFQKIMMWRIFKDEKMLFTHVPVHESVIAERGGEEFINVHGHIHNNNSPSKKHINISVEKTNYSPVNFDDIRKMIKK